MNAKPKTVSKGQQWVALQTAMLSDDDLLMCSVHARFLAIVVVLYAADQGTDGRVPANPRKVQLHARFDSVAEVQASMDELVEMDYLIATDDPDYLLIRSYSRYQTNVPEMRTAAQSAALMRWHRDPDDGHFEKTDGCAFCESGEPFGLGTSKKGRAREGVQKSQNAPEESAAPVGAPSAPATTPTATSDTQHNASSMKKELLEVAAEVVGASDNPVTAYKDLILLAEDTAHDNEGLSKDLRGYLLNALLRHALDHFLEGQISGAQYQECYRGAKALGRNGHLHYILAAQKAASADLRNKRVVGWLNKVAADSKSAS